MHKKCDARTEGRKSNMPLKLFSKMGGGGGGGGHCATSNMATPTEHLDGSYTGTIKDVSGTAAPV